MIETILICLLVAWPFLLLAAFVIDSHDVRIPRSPRMGPQNQKET
jgi:hypothetical protein